MFNRPIVCVPKQFESRAGSCNWIVFVPKTNSILVIKMLVLEKSEWTPSGQS
ncbi:hypothetical protein ACFQY3_04280 [Paenibacillus farraposensis]|uniref:hypothetical protein n=1 Tax=Paenibacillus farraposensis TaxID=2807095 RepID=UPI00360ACCFF